MQRYGSNMILERRPAPPKVIASLAAKDDMAVARRARLAADSLRKEAQWQTGWSPPAVVREEEPSRPAEAKPPDPPPDTGENVKVKKAAVEERDLAQEKTENIRRSAPQTEATKITHTTFKTPEVHDRTMASKNIPICLEASCSSGAVSGIEFVVFEDQKGQEVVEEVWETSDKDKGQPPDKAVI